MKTYYFSVFKSVFKIYIFLFFAMVFLTTSVLISCRGDDKEIKVEDSFFEIAGKQSGLSVSSSESTTSYDVRSNRPWEIVAKDSGDWVKASPSEGKDNGTFKFIVQENKTFEKRVMNFAFVVDGKEQSEKFIVEQAALGAFLKVTDGKDGLSVISDGGKVLIGIQSNAEWKYNLDDKTWLTESKKTTTQLELIAEANEAATVRKASVTITSENLPGFSEKVLITQASGAFLSIPAAIDGLAVISDGGKVLFGVQGNAAWTYTLDDNTWLTESKKTNSELELRAKTNEGAEARKVTVTITSESMPGFSAKVVITQRSKQDEQSEWELVWADEFNGSKIDLSTWSKTPRQKSDWNDAMSDADELYDLKDGKLILKGIKNINYPLDKSPYLTGGIWTRNKKTFSIGRVDVRVKTSSAQGFWPAVWLQKSSSTPSYYSELDIFEHLNFDNFVYQTLHSTYIMDVNRVDPSNHVTVNVDVDEFNIYSVELHSDRVVFLTNNQITYTYPRIEYFGDTQFPFNKFNYYIILSAQLGGGWVGEVNIDQLPVELSIDWIKVYKKK